MRRALIFSSSLDASNFETVARRLRESNFEVVTLLSDELLAGRQQLAVEFRNGSYSFRVGDGDPFSPSQIGAAWWRKPQWSDLDRRDAALRLSLELELERMHLALASLVPDASWLNSPVAIRNAESKLRQLQLASDLGLKCPLTLIANRWSCIRETFDSQDIIFKALRGGITIDDEDRVVFTQRIDLDAFEGPTAARPYPGLFQALIERAKEWRVTVVGALAFPVAVYTPAGGVDWRKDQLHGLTEFVSEPLDPDVEQAVISLVRKLGLRYAAIDLIETPKGDFVFLEANPNGQYSWLENDLGLPISDATASELAANAPPARMRTGYGG